MTRALVATSAALLLAVPSTAAAEPGSPPWDGGAAFVTPLEAKATAIAGEIAERPVRVHCNSADDWAALGAASEFDPLAAWGYVLFTRTADGWTPGDEAQLSEAACRHLDAFWLGGSPAKPPRNCRTGTRVERRTEHRFRTVRVKTAHGTVTRRKRVTVRVRVSVPVVQLCPGYVDDRLFAVQTLAHESVHLAGVEDEAVAECYGLQFHAWVARQLGAPEAVARQMAADYWNLFYLVERAGTSYFDAECRDGGMLDLAPDRPGWPSPDPVRRPK